MALANTLLRLTTRLAVIVSFTALVYGPSPGMAATAPPLGGAEAFAVLGSSTVTNTGPTIVTGDLGVSPGTSCTGFPAPCTGGPGTVIGTIHTADAVAALAQTDAETASIALVAQTCDTDLTGQDLGGMTLAPGVYCFDTSAQLTGVLTLTGGGPWIFQIGSTLTTASNSSVVNSGGGQDTDAFWAIGSSATLGTATAFTGNILAVASITLTTNASVSGRAIALNGAVTMDTNTVASICSSGDCQHPLPVPPRVSQLLIDHYQCYEAKPEDRFERQEVVLEDQFGTRTVTLKRPQSICAPVVKDADPDMPPVGTFPGDLRNPIDHLVCYKIDERSGRDDDDDDDKHGHSNANRNRNDDDDDKHGHSNANRNRNDDDDNDDNDDNEDRDIEVSVENQFGEQQLEVKRAQLLCVPSIKTLLE